MPATDRVKLKTETRGGAGRNQGRPPIAAGGTKRVNITIDEATRETLLRIGDGNLSAGIRIAAEAFAEKSGEQK